MAAPRGHRGKRLDGEFLDIPQRSANMLENLFARHRLKIDIAPGRKMGKVVLDLIVNTHALPG